MVSGCTQVALCSHQSLFICTQQHSCSPGQLIKTMCESQMQFVIDSLIHFLVGKDEELRDISGLGKWPKYRTQDLLFRQ